MFVKKMLTLELTASQKCIVLVEKAELYTIVNIFNVFLFRWEQSKISFYIFYFKYEYIYQFLRFLKIKIAFQKNY